ncbi:hypothetical protein [Streptomyces sp. NPDC014805]|uniref:hypothetical protein n=1 Tax=Streptomyces sp. NPDC014805 TaxID=3364919 RepID=UPI0037019A35
MLRRVGRCVLTYLLLYAGAWVAVALTADLEEGFGARMGLGVRLFPLVGVPALLVSVAVVTAHHRMHPVRLRFLLFVPLLLCLWPLVFADVAEPFQFLLLAHIAYAALIPAPLLPEDWAGDPADLPGWHPAGNRRI